MFAYVIFKHLTNKDGRGVQSSIVMETPEIREKSETDEEEVEEGKDQEDGDDKVELEVVEETSIKPSPKKVRFSEIAFFGIQGGKEFLV